jgi:TonB family protein
MKHLAGAAALLFATMCSAAPAAADTPGRPLCAKPAYPSISLRLGEEGISLLAFLIRPDGSVGRSVVLSSSGSADLDLAAREALGKCTFKPATDGGKPVEVWVPVLYVWTIADDPELSRAKREAASKAKKGDVDARYRLGGLLFKTATTDAERQRALVVLQSAADLGHPHAQYDLGTRYEKGREVEANLEEALRWYRKAAAQGDVLAVQRLKLGYLTE